METEILRELVVIAVAAVIAISLLRPLGLPPVAGLILSGMLLGPKGLGIVQDLHNVEVLAEVGVVLLLFGIGLELSLERIKTLWALILAGGTLQMGMTILIGGGVAWGFGLPWNTAVFLGILAAVSSTAIVLQALQARGELEAPHGRLTLGILVFQDLSVVPAILIIPLLAGQGGGGLDVLLTLLKALAVLAGVLVAAQLIVPRVLHAVALTRQRNVFVLAVFLTCMGTAWLVSLAGISLAIGAFLAGLVVSGSDYRTQALSDVIPIREVLTSVFFVSIGMLIDPLRLLSNLLPVLGILCGLVAGKFLVVFLTSALLRLPLRVAVLSGAALAQVGEFSFVLTRLPESASLLEPGLLANFTAASILSMVVTPFLIAYSPHLAAGTDRVNLLTRIMRVRPATQPARRTSALREHVIIAGLGVAGRELARALKTTQVPYVLVDMNPENVRRLAQQGEPVYFGDVSSSEVLESLRIHEAMELVLTINDNSAVITTVKAARALAPHLTIIVRTRYIGDVVGLEKAGASLIIPAEMEAAVKVMETVLARHGMGEEDVKGAVEKVRARSGEITQQEVTR